MAEPLTATFRRPFDEQVAALRLRLGNQLPTTSWTDLQKNQHDRYFVVAGAVKADVLDGLAKAVDRMAAEGATIDDFRRDFRGVVERTGWHGWTGEGTARGEAWRTRVIYNTNMLTSYQAGRLAQLREGEFKFWVYRHNDSLHPRLQHVAWDGMILPADHPFWAQHYPPNGWGCRCTVSGAYTMRGAQRLGGNPDRVLPEGWDRIDPRTGEQAGIGKGWGYMPGNSVSDVVRGMPEKAASWDPQIAAAFMREMPESATEAFGRAYRAQPQVAQGLQAFAEEISSPGAAAPAARPATFRPLGPAPQRVATEAAAQGAEDLSRFEIAVPDAGVRRSLVAPEPAPQRRPAAPADFARLAPLLDRADEISFLPEAPSQSEALRFSQTFDLERMVALFEVQRSQRRLALLELWFEQVAAGA